MKLSESTRKILENYATINDGILIRATTTGENTTLLQVCDKHKMIVAQTRIPEIFDTEVCLNDLKAFLSIISALKEPEIEFNTDHLIVRDTQSNIKMVYGNTNSITSPKKEVELPNAPLLTFLLKQDMLTKLLNLSSILSLPDLKLFGKNGKLFFQALDRNNPSTNTSAIEVGDGLLEDGNEVYFQRDLLKMIPGDYMVDIADRYSKFKSVVHDKLEYIIALAVKK